MIHPLDPFTYVLDSDHKPVQHPNDESWFKCFMKQRHHEVVTMAQRAA